MAEAGVGEKTSILKTVRIVTKWMQLVEDAKEMKTQEELNHVDKTIDQVNDLDKEVTKESSSEKEMMEFVDAFREEMALKHQQQTDSIEEDEKAKDYDNTTSRARANSTFQTVKYLARWIRIADRKRVSVGGTPIYEENDDGDEILDEDVSEEEMLEFFRSLQLSNMKMSLKHMPCPNEDNLVQDKNGPDGDAETTGAQPFVPSTPSEKLDKEAVRKTVKFVTSWMNRVEASK